MKLAVLSNVNLDLLQNILKREHNVFATEGYGQWITYAFSASEELIEFSPDFIFVLLDGYALFENVKSDEEKKKELCDNIGYIQKLAENYPHSTVVVSSIDIFDSNIDALKNFSASAFLENEWLAELQRLTKENKNLYMFDLKEFITNLGRSNIYSRKMWYMGSIPYSMNGMKSLAENISKYVATFLVKRKKVLVCDLDNTLWGGVVGEDGIDNIVIGNSLMGAIYRDTQKNIKKIAETGILLAVVSKNNYEDVINAFDNNPYMALKKEDFVRIKANWNPKVQNIRELATELNLGIDSFVFLDDNNVERESVRIEIPEVEVVDFPEDVANLPACIEDIYKKYFSCNVKTKEDAEKTEQYKQEAKRAELKSSAASLDDYLKSLNVKVVLNKAKPEQYERCVQLLNKTNQFNTNTLRMNMDEFLTYIENGGEVYTANVSDKYGDSGLVSLVFVKKENEEARIEQMLMSCRVMGRKIENAIVTSIIEKLQAEGIKKLHSSYVPSAKNKPVEMLWDNMGFTKTSEANERKEYEITLPQKYSQVFEIIWA